MLLPSCVGDTDLAALKTRVTRLEQQVAALERAQAVVVEKWSRFGEDFRTQLGVAVQIGDTREAWVVGEEEAGVGFNSALACWRDQVQIGEPVPSCWRAPECSLDRAASRCTIGSARAVSA